MLRLLLTVFTVSVGAASHAGTLTLQYIEEYGLCTDMYGAVLPSPAPSCGYTGFSDPATFVFDVSLFSPDFYYAEMVDLSYYPTDYDPVNPYSATKVDAPDGHLGGYYDLDYEITISPSTIVISGYMADGDDVLIFYPNSVLESHNQGYEEYQAFGFWTASYLPNGSNDGTNFFVGMAPVPLPNSFPLMALGLVLLGFKFGRRTI